MAKDADRTPTPVTYTHTLPLEMKQSIVTCLENLRDHIAKILVTSQLKELLHSIWLHGTQITSQLNKRTPFHRTTHRHGPLTRYVKLQVAHAPGMPGTFSPAANFKENRLLAIPACITARAWRTCRDACRDRLHAVTGKTFPAFPAHAHPQFYVSGKRPMELVIDHHCIGLLQDK